VFTESAASPVVMPPRIRVSETKRAVATSQPSAHHDAESGCFSHVDEAEMRAAARWGRRVVMFVVGKILVVANGRRSVSSRILQRIVRYPNYCIRQETNHRQDH
jgi:hypothetical protein